MPLARHILVTISESLYTVYIGVSLDIENYCTLRLFFDLVDLN